MNQTIYTSWPNRIDRYNVIGPQRQSHQHEIQMLSSPLWRWIIGCGISQTSVLDPYSKCADSHWIWCLSSRLYYNSSKSVYSL